MVTVRAAIGAVLGVIGPLLPALLTVTTIQLQTAGDRADAPARLATLRSALEAGDAALLRRQAHRVTGTRT
jgi:hypothetical protein